jgi:hypothetical protein
MSDLSEETLFKMDEQLAAGFRADHQLKQRVKLERARAVHSQMRVVDLLDIWLQREGERADAVLVYRALFDTLLHIPRHGPTAALHNRLHKVIGKRLTGTAPYPRQFDALHAHATLRYLLLGVVARESGTTRHRETAAAIVVRLLRILIGPRGTDAPLALPPDQLTLGALRLRDAAPLDGTPAQRKQLALAEAAADALLNRANDEASDNDNDDDKDDDGDDEDEDDDDDDAANANQSTPQEVVIDSGCVSWFCEVARVTLVRKRQGRAGKLLFEQLATQHPAFLWQLMPSLLGIGRFVKRALRRVALVAWFTQLLSQTNRRLRQAAEFDAAVDDAARQAEARAAGRATCALLDACVPQIAPLLVANTGAAKRTTLTQMQLKTLTKQLVVDVQHTRQLLFAGDRDSYSPALRPLLQNNIQAVNKQLASASEESKQQVSLCCVKVFLGVFNDITNTFCSWPSWRNVFKSCGMVRHCSTR